jgi:two-component system, OmpR family, response regulator
MLVSNLCRGGAHEGVTSHMSRVLVVDDEPKLVSFVRRALATRGIPADGAVDGAKGLELALSGNYELVVLDLLMPGVDGTSVLEQTVQRLPEQQILILSAFSDLDTKLRCFGLGAADYVTKPFALAELLARVHARLRGGSNGSPQLDAGGIVLDVSRRTADVGAGPVVISEREFLLLRYLLSHAGEVCTREAILADVWGVTFDPGTNVVNVCIARLRSKLGPYVIETVRNVGYCVAA